MELERRPRARERLTPAEVRVLRDEMTNYLVGQLAEARLHNGTYRLRMTSRGREVSAAPLVESVARS